MLPSSSPPSKFARFRWPLLVAGTFVLWFVSLSWPLAPDAGLDASWQQVLGYARAAHLTLGRDIVFTYGPWGWLDTVFCHPAEYWPRTLWEIVFKAVFATGWLLTAARVAPWRGIATWLVGVLFLPFFADTYYSLLAAGPLLWIGFESRPRPFPVALIGTWLGFLAMQKFTFFVMVTAGIGGICLSLILRRDIRSAILLLASGSLAALTAWLAAGQSFAALPEFLRNSFSVASGYQQAMALNEHIATFWSGLATAGLLTVLAIGIARRPDANRFARITLALTFAGFCFLFWKHGFIRADGHVLAFFFPGLVAALVMSPLRLAVPLGAAAFTGIAFTIPGLVLHAPAYARLHFTEGVHGLLHPRGQHRHFLQLTADAASLHDLPIARRIIADAPVDVFGHEQSAALLNTFNYHPRPVFQGYQTCSPALAELNAAWFIRPSAADFFLARVETIDDRLPALDDARLLPLLLAHAKPIAEDAGFLVLRRDAHVARLEPAPLMKVEARPGQRIPLPSTDAPLWLEVDWPPSLPGRLRAFLYKPAQTRIRIELANGETREFRFNPAAARGGFLLSPFLPDTPALKTWFALGSAPRINAITLLPARHFGWTLDSQIALRFSTLDLSKP